MTLFIKEDAEDGLRSGTQDQELNFEYDYFEIFVISLSEDVREVFGYMNQQLRANVQASDKSFGSNLKTVSGRKEAE